MALGDEGPLHVPVPCPLTLHRLKEEQHGSFFEAVLMDMRTWPQWNTLLSCNDKNEHLLGLLHASHTSMHLSAPHLCDLACNFVNYARCLNKATHYRQRIARSALQSSPPQHQPLAVVVARRRDPGTKSGLIRVERPGPSWPPGMPTHPNIRHRSPVVPTTGSSPEPKAHPCWQCFGMHDQQHRLAGNLRRDCNHAETLAYS